MIKETAVQKAQEFSQVLLSQTVERMNAQGLTHASQNYEVQVIPGRKYINVNIGPVVNMSGKYMVEIETGIIFGIKAYGQVHKGHSYGTLETIDLYDWSGYVGIKKQVNRVEKTSAEMAQIITPYKKIAKFEKGAGLYRCFVCKNMTRETGGDGSKYNEICDKCAMEAGLENEHSDNGGHGENYNEFDEDCPTCRAERDAKNQVVEVVEEVKSEPKHSIPGDIVEPKNTQHGLANRVLMISRALDRRNTEEAKLQLCDMFDEIVNGGYVVENGDYTKKVEHFKSWSE